MRSKTPILGAAGLLSSRLAGLAVWASMGLARSGGGTSRKGEEDSGKISFVGTVETEVRIETEEKGKPPGSRARGESRAGFSGFSTHHLFFLAPAPGQPSPHISFHTYLAT